MCDHIDLEEQRAEQDADMARRLQRTFDREYTMERADGTLARQLNKEASETDISNYPLPTSPPTDVEREHEREQLARQEWESRQEGDREREQEQERLHQRQKDDLLLAERLQSEEQDRLKRELERKMKETQHSTETEVEPARTDDEQLAFQLQNEEIRKAEVHIQKTKKKINKMERKRRLLEKKHTWNGEERDRESDSDSHSEGEDSDQSNQSPVQPPHSPPPPQDTSGDPPRYDDIPMLEPYDDNEQPRLKPLPKPLKKGEDRVPCQFCKKTFPFHLIMYHQERCMAYDNEAHSRLRERARERGRAVEVNLEEVLREDKQQERGSSVLCQYCHKSYSTTVIDPHQALCEKNPDKHLKYAYQSRLKNAPVTATTVSMPTTRASVETQDDILPCEYCQATFSPKKLLYHEAICENRPHSLPKNPQQATPSSPASEAVPCQFCNQLIPFSNIIKHETICRFQGPYPPSTIPHPTPPTTTAPTRSTRPSSHLPPSAIPQLTPTTTAPTRSTRPSSHLPPSAIPQPTPPTTTAPTRSTRPSQQRTIAAVFPRAPSPAPITVPSTLTDDQKTTLLSSLPPTTAASVSSAHPSSNKLTKGGALSHRMSQPLSLHGQLPQIYMRTSSSQPHSIGGVIGERRGTVEGQSSLNVRERSVDQQQFQPRHNNVTATHNGAQLQAHAMHTHVSTQGMQLTTAVGTLRDSVTPTTATITTVPTSQNRGSPPLIPPEDPPQLIGTDTSIVRPTHSDIVALQCQTTVPTPISLPTSVDVMAHPLKMASLGSSALSNLSLVAPISTAPLKESKSTQDKTLYNVQVNTHNTLLGTDKGSFKMMPDALIQKPMAVQGVTVLLPPVQNTGINTLKDSSSNDATLTKSPSKTKQLNIAKPSDQKGKGVLKMIKITPSSPNNLSPEIMESKSFSLTVDQNSSRATSNSTAHLPNSAVDYSTHGDRESPLSTDRHSLSPDGDSSDSGSEGTSTLTAGPLVECTGTCTYTAASPTSEYSAQWDNGSGSSGRATGRGTKLEAAAEIRRHREEVTRLSQPSSARKDPHYPTSPAQPSFSHARKTTPRSKQTVQSTRTPVQKHTSSASTRDSGASSFPRHSAPGGRRVGSKPSSMPSNPTTACSKPSSQTKPSRLKSNEAGPPQRSRPTPKPRKNATSSAVRHGTGHNGKKY